MLMLTKFLDEVRERIAKTSDDLAGVLAVLDRQWPIARIKVQGAIFDLKQDIDRLVWICELQRKALEKIDAECSRHDTTAWTIANDALEQADAIAKVDETLHSKEQK